MRRQFNRDLHVTGDVYSSKYVSSSRFCLFIVCFFLLFVFQKGFLNVLLD